MSLSTLFLILCQQQPSRDQLLKPPFQPVAIRSDSPELIALYAEARRVMKAVLGDRFDAWQAVNSEVHLDATRDPFGVRFCYGSGTARMDPRGRFVSYNRSWSSPKSDLNLLTREEATEMAKRFVVATSPRAYTLVDAEVQRMDDQAITVGFHIGLEANHDATAIARFMRFSATFDRRLREPIYLHCLWHDLPRIDPNTTHTRIEQVQLDLEADRVYRAMAPIPDAFVTRGFVYQVPAFSDAAHEMTDEQKRMEKDRRPTLLYEWAVVPKRGGWSQDIYVDARTGKAVAWKRFYFPTISSLVSAAPGLPDEASNRWQLMGQKGWGTLTPDRLASAGDNAVNCVLVSASGRTVTAQYHAPTNHVQIGNTYYKVSGAIIKALKHIPVPSTFGTRPEKDDKAM